ncbi:serine hydrolase [Streptomyces sp. NPDC046900]|uniref:serine hydrolase n=1 Tax=Streptomyces sp. NPDC046900 TaxID=3155473 RepID=UPI0033FEBEA0
MPHGLFPTPRPDVATRRRVKRVVACAGVLLASATALFSAGALDPSPATAATSPVQDGTAPARSAPVQPQGSTPQQPQQPQQPQNKARVTAAVYGLDGGGKQPALSGQDTPYDTASIVKVDILAAVLLQAQDAGRPLTAQEDGLARAMIQHSDNASADALWREIGQAPGLAAANKRLGLTSTQGGAGFLWGLTRTTASDQIRLLRAVFESGPSAQAGSRALHEPARGYIRTLMTRIAADQSWGVSAVAGNGWALKNGWLQRTTTGLWDINSIGEVSKNGHHYLVAVLSDGNPTMQDGVSLVERTAQAAVSSASAH